MTSVRQFLSMNLRCCPSTSDHHHILDRALPELELSSDAERRPGGVPKELHSLDARLVKLRVPAKQRKVDRRRELPTRIREYRVIDGVVDETRRQLAHRATPPCADQQGIEDERIPA